MTSSFKKYCILYFLLFMLLYIPFIYRNGIALISSPNVDFPCFYSAAKVAFGMGLSPYHYRSLVHDRLFVGPPFIYPPTSLLFYYPFTLLPYEAAGSLMLFLNHVFLLVAIYLCLHKILRLDIESPFWAFVLVYVFSFRPIINTLALGQINLLMLVLICLTWSAYLSKCKPLFVAIPLSIAILLKVYPGVILIYFLARRRLGIVAWTAALMVALIGVTWFVLPHGAWADWLEEIVPIGGYGRISGLGLMPASPWNQSLNAFLSRLLTPTKFSEMGINAPGLVRLVMYPTSLLLIFFAATLSYLSARRNEGDGSINLELSMFFLAMFLVAPLSWEHHLTLYLPALLYLGYHAMFSEESVYVKLLVGLSLLVAALNLNLASPLLQKGVLTLLISIKLYAVIVLWTYAAVSVTASLWRRIPVCDVSNM